MDITDITEARARRPAVAPPEIDHRTRAWSISPSEADAEANRYQGWAGWAQKNADSPGAWAGWSGLAEKYRGLADLYGAAASFRGPRGCRA